MQGNVFMDTITKFMPTFFKELQVDGRIDRAMAVARSEGKVPCSVKIGLVRKNGKGPLTLSSISVPMISRTTPIC
ncbi:MAG: hypothetical protein HQL32_10515 [Planctomycetes bacterium]|nr:hypothetical protein [Planctomycetota bacterium]